MGPWSLGLRLLSAGGGFDSPIDLSREQRLELFAPREQLPAVAGDTEELVEAEVGEANSPHEPAHDSFVLDYHGSVAVDHVEHCRFVVDAQAVRLDEEGQVVVGQVQVRPRVSVAIVLSSLVIPSVYTVVEDYTSLLKSGEYSLKFRLSIDGGVDGRFLLRSRKGSK